MPPPLHTLADAALEVRWRSAGDLLASFRDVLLERAEGEAPRWATARDWSCWLAELSADQLDMAEQHGLSACLDGAPADLVSLVGEAVARVDLPVQPAPGTLARARSVKQRKRPQVAAFAAAVADLARGAPRIVDFGAGHGHLTRHLAEAFDVDALGVDRVAAHVEAATAHGGPTRFVTFDLLEEGFPLRSGDLLVGLHACGALTDRLVTTAARRGCSAAWVSCCLQRTDDALRAPLVARPGLDLDLPQRVLGLSNARPQTRWVRSTLPAVHARRARREALRLLLQDRGVAVPPGDEMRGLTQRQLNPGLEAVAGRVLARRGLPAPTAAELSSAEAAGQRASEARRRFELPRRALGPVLELYVNLDRAMYLCRAGYTVALTKLFDDAVSPRNTMGLCAPP